MSLRKPLVMVAGQIERLQAGDTLDATVAELETILQTNDEAGALVIGTPVYNDTNDGVKKAQADAATTVEVLGFATQATVATGQPASIQTSGVMTATTTQWDAVAATADSQSGGLAAGTVYFLDHVAAGKITKIGTDTSGKYVVRLGKALSTTELLINIQEPILL